jgi:UDP-glucose 4-epimerase
VIDTASRITECEIPYKAIERRPGDPAVLIASNEKALQVLGWRPRYPELDTIISSAWNWHRKLK